MTALHLDSRVVRMLWWLLDQQAPRSTSDLASALGVTTRMVRYRLDALELGLAARGLALHRQRGIGIWLGGPESAIAELRTELSELSEPQRAYTTRDRAEVLLATLLWASPEPVSISDLEGTLGASKTSMFRSLEWCEEWLAQRRLRLKRRTGVGISVIGDECRLRSALVAQIVGAVPPDVLDELCIRPIHRAATARVQIPAGLREHLARLPLRQCAKLTSQGIFGGTLDLTDSEHALVAYFAVTAARLKSGKTVEVDVEMQRIVADNPAASATAAVLAEFGQAFDLAMGHSEITAASAYVLGLAVVSSADPLPTHQHDELAQRMLEQAGRRLSKSIAEDSQLRRNLHQHLARLAIRMRYGLPVHNPLRDEVAQRYPEIHRVASDLGADMAQHFDTPMSDDEISFVTMYLSGAVERSKARRRPRRAVVICHSGMASAWVLVSRLAAEFPELELLAVAGVNEFATLDLSDADLVVSTDPLDDGHAITGGGTTVGTGDGEIPVLVVSPLLDPEDVGMIAAHL